MTVINRSNKILVVFLFSALTISVGLLAVSITSMVESNRQLQTLLDIDPNILETIPSEAPPSIDEQILIVQNKLRVASNSIRRRKGDILSHAFGAQRALDGYVIDERAVASLRNARELINDIAENSKLILERNEEIEEESLRLYSLYQRKIETLLAAKQVQKDSSFGMAFWAGLFGLIATVSGIALAWRKDALEHRKDLREQAASQEI